MLSEADFWRGRQAQLQQRLQGGKGPSQRAGLSSVMLAHMQGSQDGRSNTVRGLQPAPQPLHAGRQAGPSRHRLLKAQGQLTPAATAQVIMRLTPELVQQIFAERPHVKRAHAALVPQSMDEKAFWSHFMKHEMARRVGGLCGGTGCAWA